MSDDAKALDGRTICDCCKRGIDDDTYLTEVNPEGGYGRPRFLACDPCMEAAEPGSYMAEMRDRHR